MYKVEWEEFMNHILNEGYDTVVHFNENEDDENYDEDCVYCPECGDPIYREDFPEIDADNKYYYCPVCETGF